MLGCRGLGATLALTGRTRSSATMTFGPTSAHLQLRRTTPAGARGIIERYRSVSPWGNRQGNHHPPAPPTPTARCSWQRIGSVANDNAAGGSVANDNAAGGNTASNSSFDCHQGGRAPISKGVNGVNTDGDTASSWPPSNVGSGRANGGVRFAPTHLQGWAHLV